VNEKGFGAFVDRVWDLARGLVQSFADTANAVLATIRTAVAAGDFLALSEAAHVIKGASANLFASAVVVEARRLEEAAKLRDVVEIKMCAERASIEVGKAVEYFRTWMGS
jgi:HPt (histidine-containing phosphotransfer) domain-containing protein